jgi:hypothetical protein
MKKLIPLFITILLLSSCKKEKLPESNDNNPILISITINDETSEIVRVK